MAGEKEKRLAELTTKQGRAFSDAGEGVLRVTCKSLAARLFRGQGQSKFRQFTPRASSRVFGGGNAK